MNKTEREKPPMTRESITHEIKVGAVKVYATLCFADTEHKKPCDLLIVINQTSEKSEVDSAHRGWANLCSTFIGMALQRGVPLEIIIDKMIGYRFPPDDGIRGAKSIPDAIAKWLKTQVKT